MCKTFLISLLGLLTHALIGQQISQQVINSSGSVFQSTTFSLTSNVGEAITTTFNTGNNILSQGFIQPIKTDVPTSLRPFADLDDKYTIYPTITLESVSFEFSDKTIDLQKFEIYGNDGRLVKSISNPQNAINLSDLANGIYWLRPIVANKQFGLKKIIKTR